MIATMIAPETASLLPAPVLGQPGFNANTCPRCGDRCGDLINGQCLGCEIGWQEKFVGAEAVETYCCSHCETEFDVLVAQDENGVWLLVDGDAERCPSCGKWGQPLAESEPDAYWSAAERSGEEQPDAVIETKGGPILFFFI